MNILGWVATVIGVWIGLAALPVVVVGALRFWHDRRCSCRETPPEGQPKAGAVRAAAEPGSDAGWWAAAAEIGEPDPEPDPTLSPAQRHAEVQQLRAMYATPMDRSAA